VKARPNVNPGGIRDAVKTAAVPAIRLARKSLGSDQMLEEISQLRTDMGVRVGYLTTMVESPRAAEPLGDPYYEQLLGMLADELDRTKNQLALAIERIDKLELATKRPGASNGRKA
jgi:hypothetical protein